MRTCLVTGGAGFIGSNFIKYVLSHRDDIRIINLDKLTYAGNLENLKDIEGDPRYKFIHADICDDLTVDDIFKTEQIDYVVNFAAESHVDRSIKDPSIFARTNVLGTQNLLNSAKSNWEKDGTLLPGKRFLQVSTDEVYGSLGAEGLFSETTPLDPHSPYSASKAGADLIVKAYYDTFAFPALITRCSNNYGPYQFPEKLIPLVINNCLNKKPLPVYGDGKNIRDWLYVDDHAKALLLVLEDGTPGEVYNIGGNNEQTNIDIIRMIISYLHDNVDSTITDELITFVPDRLGHDRRYGIDASKIKNELGWQPETTFEAGIVKTIQWYLNNMPWLKSVTSGQYLNYYKEMYEG